MPNVSSPYFSFGCKVLTWRSIVFAMQSPMKGVLRPFAIRSYSHANSYDPLIRNPECDTTDISILDACRATSATPKYFDKVEIDGHGSFLDGSVWRVNPAEEAYREIQDLHVGDADSIAGLLSIGHVKYGRREFASNPQRTLSNIVDLAEDNDVDCMLRGMESESFRYDRLICPTRSDLGSGSVDKWFARLAADAQKQLASDEMQSRIRKWAELLVSVRRRRARTVRWQNYADLRTACPFCSPTESPMLRSSLFAHIKKVHGGEKQFFNVATKGKQDFNGPTKVTVV